MPVAGEAIVAAVLAHGGDDDAVLESEAANRERFE
jgi:hypothetical protein